MNCNWGFNTSRPLVMHVDLNSCFATVEQQARPMLRGRPVAIVNRRAERATIVTASYEARASGVSLGMSLSQAKRLCPDLVGVESDPPKYRHVYHKLISIMSDYSPHIQMKSIDEGVIDFTRSTDLIKRRDLVEVGYEIKRRLKEEIGCHMRCNIGIAPNRFLAKMAASLHKPDGLDVINHENLREVMSELTLKDLTGIASRNEHRLNAVGIYTPLDMLDATPEMLHEAFHSICGEQWHQRLRGWEVDDVDYDLKSCGRQYVMEVRGASREVVMARMHNLVESVGAKLRKAGKSARGVGVYVRMSDGDYLGSSNGRWGKKGGYWHEKYLAPLPFYSDQAIWRITKRLMAYAPTGDVREIGVHCYHLHDGLGDQLSLFGDELAREQRVVWAIDEINARYGDRTIHSGNTLGTDDLVKQKIPFGSTRYL